MLLRLPNGLNKIILSLMAIFLLCPFEATLADAPFITDSAIPLDPGSHIAYLYATGDKVNRFITVQEPAVEFDYGVSSNFEIDAYLPILTNNNAAPILRSIIPNQTGISDLDIEFKYQLIPETKYHPAFSFAPNVFVPLGNANRGLGNGRVWAYYPITIEKSLNDWRAYAEIAYAVNRTRYAKNFFLGGCVVEKKINDTITLGGEIYSQGASYAFNDAFTILNLGGFYNLSKSTSLLASVGHSVIGPPRWAAYVGISWS